MPHIGQRTGQSNALFVAGARSLPLTITDTPKGANTWKKLKSITPIAISVQLDDFCLEVALLLRRLLNLPPLTSQAEGDDLDPTHRKEKTS